MFISALFALFATWGAAPHSYVLETGDPIWDVAAQDLDGDGVKDILALCSATRGLPVNKYVAVFLSQKNGGYPKAPSLYWALEARDGAVFFAEIDGQPPREMIVTSPRGATAFRFVEGSFQPAGNYPFINLLPGGTREPVFMPKAAQDLTGDGIDEWLIPVPGAYEVRGPGGLYATLPCDILSEMRRYNSTIVYHRLPASAHYTLEEDEPQGLVFLSDETADFYYGADWGQHDQFRIPAKLDEKWDASTRLEDLNNDGFPDLIVTQTSGTINLQAVTHVYLASKPFTYPEKPSATFESRGAMTIPLFRDINGDNKKDAIIISIPLGLRNIVNYFIRKKVSVKVEVFELGTEGFSKEPSARTHLTFGAPEGREQVAFAIGDFTGDGRMDAAYGISRTELGVFEGKEGRVLASTPFATFSMPTFGVSRTTDLNADGRTDLVLFHPGTGDALALQVVIF